MTARLAKPPGVLVRLVQHDDEPDEWRLIVVSAVVVTGTKAECKEAALAVEALMDLAYRRGIQDARKRGENG